MKHSGVFILVVVELVIMTPFFLLGFVFELMACGFGAGREGSKDLALKMRQVHKEIKK